jgi:hypothetical protein
MGGVSTGAILIVVLVLLVLGDIAVVYAWTHRKRKAGERVDRSGK